MAAAIRRAAAGDVPAIVALWKEMWEAHAAADARMEASPLAELVMRRWMEEHLASARSEIVVAEDGGRLVGYALGTILENPPVVPHQFYGYFSDLSVTATSRRSGIGRRLAEALHDWFRAKRMPYVQVNVAVKNSVARSFWRRAGYSEFVEQLRLELT